MVEMKERKSYKNHMRVKLNKNFRIKLFETLFEICPTKKLAKKFDISRGMLYHYKNGRARTISLFLLEKFIEITRIPKSELNDNIIEFISSKELRDKGLNAGREFRKRQIQRWKNEIPTVSELVSNGYIDIGKWFNFYRKLIEIGGRKIKSVEVFGNKIALEYTNYVKGKKETFISLLPRRIILDENFQYFFGLWCGDKASGGRLGILNKQEELILFVDKYLRKIYQNPKFVLFKSSNTNELPSLSIKIDEIIEIKNMPGDYVIAVFAINGILKSFFDYLDGNLEEFLNILSDRNIFFAGLFDAEGNVFFEDQCFRWSCKDDEKVKIYEKFLRKNNLFRRYDGANLVTSNLRVFSKLILPHLKHKEKLNAANLVCFGKGNLDSRFKNILKIIKENEGLTMKGLATILKRKKVYSPNKIFRKV